MNPLVHKKFQQLQDAIAQIDENVHQAHEQTASERANKERLIQQHWRERKDLLAQRSLADSYDQVQQENQRLLKERKEFLTRLERVMHLLKALGAELS